jgi:pyruvate dehydrogenase E1 component alpha subunit
MHFFTAQLLGGYGIVGGQIPISTGAAFTIKYKQKNTLQQKDSKQVSVCFFGEGAVAQGAFHESLNLASLWDLPCIYVIENNHWGMGTHVTRAICLEPIAETKAPSFNMESYTLDGMDFFNCYAGFRTAFEKVKKTSRPILIEVITERFKGHSISDPALYRSKDELKNNMQKDPISFVLQVMQKEKMITQSEYQELDKEQKKVALDALKYADESPWPDPSTLEQDVLKESD